MNLVPPSGRPPARRSGGEGRVSRRRFLKYAGVGAALLAGAGIARYAWPYLSRPRPPPPSGDGFRFTAFGDSGFEGSFAGNLELASALGAHFVLHVGDMTYDNSTSAIDTFANQVKGTLGPDFPYMMTGGNHEGNDSSPNDGSLYAFTSRLPPRLTLDPVAQTDINRYFGVRYYFDFPQPNPYARIFGITPGEGSKWGSELTDFSEGSATRLWMRDAIREAKANGWWVIAGNHRNWISAGGKSDEIGETFMNLIFEEKVDLLIQGHEHNYQRSKLLTGPAVNDSCVILDEGPTTFTARRGTILLINGCGGHGEDPFNMGDSAARFWAAWNASSSRQPPAGSGQAQGSAFFEVTPAQIRGAFRSIGGHTYADDFVLG